MPIDLREKLQTAAAKEHLKGFSPIIVRALHEYFEHNKQIHPEESIRKLRGSLSRKEYREAMDRLEEGRDAWRM